MLEGCIEDCLPGELAATPRLVSPHHNTSRSCRFWPEERSGESLMVNPIIIRIWRERIIKSK